MEEYGRQFLITKMDPKLFAAVKLFAVGRGVNMTKAVQYLLRQGLIHEAGNPENSELDVEVIIIARPKKVT